MRKWEGTFHVCVYHRPTGFKALLKISVELAAVVISCLGLHWVNDVPVSLLLFSFFLLLCFPICLLYFFPSHEE